MLRWVCYLEHLTEQNLNITSFPVLPLQCQGALMIIPVTLQRLMEVMGKDDSYRQGNKCRNLLNKTDLETFLLRMQAILVSLIQILLFFRPRSRTFTIHEKQTVKRQFAGAKPNAADVVGINKEKISISERCDISN